jgi:CHAD domain-containing protein
MPNTPDIAEYLDGLVASLCMSVPRALRTWDEDALHEARVATRRMKVAMEALESLFPVRLCKSYSRTLRQIRRRLGPLRDIDVMLGHLRSMQSLGRHARVAAWLRERMLTEQADLRRRSLDKVALPKLLAELGVWWGLKEAAGDLRGAVPPILLAALPALIDEYSGLARQVHEVRSNAAGPASEPHQLRIVGKALRYTLEMTTAAGLGPHRRVLQQFKQLQDALGLWHDFAVLSQRTMLAAIGDEVAYHDPALYYELLGLSRASWQRAARRLVGFDRSWQENGSAVIRDLTAMLPKVEPAPPAIQSQLPGVPATEAQTDEQVERTT